MGTETVGDRRLASRPGGKRRLLVAQPCGRSARRHRMLHDWDPIGVYGGDDPNPSPDEYDDLVSPILTALRANPDPTSLARQLREVLSSDRRRLMGLRLLWTSHSDCSPDYYLEPRRRL